MLPLRHWHCSTINSFTIGAETLAASIVSNESDVERQIRQAWSNVLSRQPTGRELKLSLKHVRRQAAVFAASSRDEPPQIRIAEVRLDDRDLSGTEAQHGERQLIQRNDGHLSVDGSRHVSSNDILALASLCHVLMNSNEFLYID